MRATEAQVVPMEAPQEPRAVNQPLLLLVVMVVVMVLLLLLRAWLLHASLLRASQLHVSLAVPVEPKLR